MEPYIFFLGLIIPQIAFGFAFLHGVAWIFKRDEKARVEKKRLKRLEALLGDLGDLRELDESGEVSAKLK